MFVVGKNDDEIFLSVPCSDPGLRFPSLLSYRKKSHLGVILQIVMFRYKFKKGYGCVLAYKVLGLCTRSLSQFKYRFGVVMARVRTYYRMTTFVTLM